MFQRSSKSRALSHFVSGALLIFIPFSTGKNCEKWKKEIRRKHKKHTNNAQKENQAHAL